MPWDACILSTTKAPYTNSRGSKGMCPQTSEFFAAMKLKAGVDVLVQMARAASRKDYDTATLLLFSLLTINRRTAGEPAHISSTNSASIMQASQSFRWPGKPGRCVNHNRPLPKRQPRRTLFKGRMLGERNYRHLCYPHIVPVCGGKAMKRRTLISFSWSIPKLSHRHILVCVFARQVALCFCLSANTRRNSEPPIIIR